MMRKNKTELVFILDKSGSMSGLEADTIGGFNAMLKKLQKADGEAYVTTVLFNHDYELLHDRISVKGISPLTEADYETGGTTALFDALGVTIQKINNVQKRTCPSERSDKVLFVITTDGMENTSKKFNAEKINKMIRQQKEKYGWTFIFLGANIDAVATAAHFGIEEDFAVNYHADNIGTQLNYEAINEAVSSIRCGKKIVRSWKERVEKDYNHRKKLH